MTAPVVVGLVPARGGSRGVPRKNLVELAGKPLLAYTAAAALGSSSLHRAILSTDDDEIAEAGRELGLEVPFRRPAALARDDTPMVAVVRHALDELEAAGTHADVLVLLQPTSPLRRAWHIDTAVELLLRERAATVVSVVSVPHRFSPGSLMICGDDGHLVPLYGGSPWPTRRQDKPPLYARNGPAVLAVRAGTVLSVGLYGTPTLPLEMSPLESIDIDEPTDLVLAEALLRSDWRDLP